MTQTGEDFRLKLFSITENMDLEANGKIKDLLKTNPAFINEFLGATMINENNLVVSDKKMVKIYNDCGGKSRAHL